MRFYKEEQAEMLNRVSFMLNKEQDKLTKRVPALKQFITEFVDKEKELYAILNGNPNLVKRSALQKGSVREAFEKAVWKLIVVLKASRYRVKNQPISEMSYTEYSLSKLSADKLSKAYLNVYRAAKKIKNVSYYGLSAEDMRDMQAYNKEFTDIKNAPALKKEEGASNTKKLNKGVKECIDFLEDHIDSLMYIAAENDPSLMNNYQALRKVLPRGQGRPSDQEANYRERRGHKKRVVD